MVDERALKLARSAREQLGEALGTLQMEELPLSLFDVTAQVAKAMGLLLRFEQEGDGRIADEALLAVRTTLGVLQTCSPRLPAVDKSAQAVAGALGLVHSVRELAALPAVQLPAPAAAGSVGSVLPVGAERGKTQIGYSAPLASADHTDTVREPLSGRGSSDAVRAMKPVAQAGNASTAKSASAPIPSTRQVAIRKETLAGAGPEVTKAIPVQPAPATVRQDISGQAAGAAPAQNTAQQDTEKAEAAKRAAREHHTQPEPRRALDVPASAKPQPDSTGSTKANARGTLPAAGAGDTSQVQVALGAHSPSNFFAGLAGLNVVDNGGLFIATYDVATVGQTLLLNVVLPGGHEFSADAVVMWQREPARHTTPGLPPGYGVKFTRISEAGRKLIERYIAHREPFFYDEL